MKTRIVEKASEAIRLPEVEQMIKELAKHGLGVCVPHMHDPVTNELIPLPPNMVQMESNLKVTFVERDKTDERQVAVAWIWDSELKAVQRCTICQPPDGPHH